MNRMNGRHGTRMRIFACVFAAVAAAFAWAGAAGRASAAGGWTAGVSAPGAWDGSAAGAARAAGSWGKAMKVPGLAALNTGGNARVSSVSCASAGNCAAGGDYWQPGDRYQGFVADERNGVWGTAIEVPGLAALNTGRGASVGSVSCASPGNCAAGGDYSAGEDVSRGFVAVERNGVWGTAIEVPGLAALGRGGESGVESVSCGSAGSCVAGGKYLDGDDHLQGFVAAERNGVWGTAIEVPGLAALHKRGGTATVFSVSCASAGNCAAGGSYHYDHHHQGFVADERNGVWHKALEVPGLAALNTGGQGLVSAVSCASAGNCAAGGYYTHGGWQGFVAGERNGVWGRAIELPGLRTLNTGGFAEVDVLSCASAGNCAASGGYSADGAVRGFVADERNGVWRKAIELPGLAALSTGARDKENVVESVSCGSAGNCAAGGDAWTHRGTRGFVAAERNGVWGTAIEVPGLAALSTGGYAWVFSVSCAPAGTCAAGGSYADAPDNYQGFVASQTG